jgi:hypothetical protein
MDVCPLFLCVLFRACSGLATGWSPVQGVLPTAYKGLEYQINCDGNRPEGLIRKVEEEEEEEEEEK